MQTDMTRGNPFTIIMKFMIPLMLGNIFQQLYNMADTIIVGRTVGQGALAAVGSTGTIMFLMQGFSIGLTTGFTVLTSQSYGAGCRERVRRSVANAVLLSLIMVAAVTAVFVISMRGILHLMNTPDDIYQDAYSYIIIIAWGLIACVSYNLGSSLLRAIGNSRVPLYTLVFSACLNVVLDIVLIVVFHMGVAGAAVATDISQGLSAVVCFLYIGKKAKILVPQKEDWRLNPADTRVQMNVGLPMALQFAITASGTMVMQSAINTFGSVAVAAFTSASKLQSVLTQNMIAMGQSMATYSGQNFGAGKTDRIRQGVKTAMLTQAISSVLCSILVLTLTPLTLKFFFTGGTDISLMMPYADAYVRCCAVCYIPLSMIFIFRNTMQGCGYGFLPMMGGVIEFFTRFSVAQIAIHTHRFFFAAACDPAAWVAAAIFTGIAYLHVIRDVEKKHPQAAAV